MKIEPQYEEFENRNGEWHEITPRDVKQKLERNQTLFLPFDADYIESNSIRESNIKRLSKSIRK